MPIPSSSSVPALTATAYACMAVFGVVLLLMGSLLPLMAVGYAQAGTLGSLPLAGILAATTIVGPFIDTVGAKSILAVSIALIGIPILLMPSLRGFGSLAVAAFIYGFGGGLLNTAVNAFVSDLHAASRGTALNLLGAFFSLGAIAAPVLMSAAGGANSSRVVLPVLATAILLLLIPLLLLRFPPPSQAGTSALAMLHVLRQPLVWFFGLLLFFESGDENCMFVWGGKVIHDALRVTSHHADAALAALTIALGGGRLLALLWLRWLGRRGTLLLSAFVVVIGSAVAHTGTSYSIMAAGLMLIGVGMSAIYPTTLAQVGDQFPRETGTAFGAIMALALVGGAGAPRLAAVIAGNGTAPLNVLWIPLAGSIAIAIMTALLPRPAVTAA